MNLNSNWRWKWLWRYQYPFSNPLRLNTKNFANISRKCSFYRSAEIIKDSDFGLENCGFLRHKGWLENFIGDEPLNVLDFFCGSLVLINFLLLFADFLYTCIFIQKNLDHLLLELSHNILESLVFLYEIFITQQINFHSSILIASLGSEEILDEILLWNPSFFHDKGQFQMMAVFLESVLQMPLFDDQDRAYLLLAIFHKNFSNLCFWDRRGKRPFWVFGSLWSAHRKCIGCQSGSGKGGLRIWWGGREGKHWVLFQGGGPEGRKLL